MGKKDLEIVKKFKEKLSKKFPIIKMILFGSRASGKVHEWSDFDIIIVSDKYHLARSVFLALRNGFYPVYWTSPDGHYYSKDDWQYYYMREFIAILGYIPKFITN